MIRRKLYHYTLRLLGYQILITSTAALGVGVFLGWPPAVAMLAGSSVSIIASGCLAAYLFRDVNAQNPRRMLANLFKGEVIKFLLTLILFGLFIQFYKAAAVPFLLGYVLAQVMALPQLLWMREI